MSDRPQPTTALRRDRHPDRARWLVPVAISILGFITLILILFALGVLLGLIRF